jgi:hypothetical protein
MLTLAESVALTGKPVHIWLDPDWEVPRIDTCAAQGDILLLRVASAADTPMPRTVVLVASEASANTHTLHPIGTCYFDRHTATDPTGDVLLGVLTVPDGSTALLSHQEHGNIEFLPGSYEVRRQREFAGEWRLVYD